MKYYFIFGVAVLLGGFFIANYFRSDSMSATKIRTVAIIGGGAAGMSAALELSRQARPNIKIFLYDKEPKLGGNSAKASSGINGVHTSAQIMNHIPDTEEAFNKDVIVSGQSLANPTLVHTLVHQSTQAIVFLQSLGVNLDVLSQCGGHQFPRTHRSKPDETAKVQKNIGSIITSTLEAALRADPYVHIFASTSVTALLHKDGEVKGIQVNGSEEIPTDAVILTSGGYGRDSRLLHEYVPNIENLPSTNGDFTTGDGVHMARNISAGLVLMDQVQIHPTGLINPKRPHDTNKFLAAEAIRAYGAILVNQQGQRFVNELGLRDHVTEGIFRNCSRYSFDPENRKGNVFAFMIVNQHVIREFGETLMSFYAHKGFLQKFASLKEFAERYEVPIETLQNTLERYNQAAAGELSDSFGKTRFPTTFDLNGEFGVFFVTPSIHYTMGGVSIDEHARVLDVANNPIRNLFAAGEVTGGVHGKNRLAGNSLLECVVYGRIAANSVLS